MRARAALAAGAVLLASCGAPRWSDCHDTVTCRALAEQRQRELRVAVEEVRASQPAGVPVTRVAPDVIADRAHETVYAITSDGLVALDLRTGQPRWQHPGVAGALYRIGPALLAVAAHARGPHPRGSEAEVHAFAPSTARPSVRRCTIPITSAGHPNRMSLHAFTLRGATHLYWSAAVSWEGGAPPPEDFDSAPACGAMRLDLDACGASEVSLDAVLWSRSEIHHRSTRERCEVLAPLHDIPAAVASEPDADAGAEPTLRVELVRNENPCIPERRVLVAGEPELWRVEVQPVEDRGRCVP